MIARLDSRVLGRSGGVAERVGIRVPCGASVLQLALVLDGLGDALEVLDDLEREAHGVVLQRMLAYIRYLEKMIEHSPSQCGSGEARHLGSWCRRQ